jgi:hypothetical protein
MIETIASNEMDFFRYSKESGAKWKPTNEYIKNIMERRLVGQQKAEQNMKSSMKLLEYNYNWIRAIRLELKGENPPIKSEIINEIEQKIKAKGRTNKFFKNRIKHLLFAFLGYRLTNKIARRF